MRTHIALPEPIGIYPYFDKIQFWVRKPLDKKVIEWLWCAPRLTGQVAGCAKH
jgi:hypothetical protein